MKKIACCLAICIAVAGCVTKFNRDVVPDLLPTDDPVTDNTKYGFPSSDDVYDRKGYSIGFSNRYRQPRWVSYNLTRDKVVTNRCKRTNDFRVDPQVTNSAELADYKLSGYDRGHLAPAADMGWDKDAMSESFYLSNMSPQVPMFNRGIWKELEEWVRVTASNEESIVVITGPVFYTNRLHKVIGKRKNITVPEAYYKVIYDETPPVKMIAFVLNNEPSTNSLRYFTCTVDRVERMTNLDFFKRIPKSAQRELESNIDASEWLGL